MSSENYGQGFLLFFCSPAMTTTMNVTTWVSRVWMICWCRITLQKFSSVNLLTEYHIQTLEGSMCRHGEKPGRQSNSAKVQIQKAKTQKWIVLHNSWQDLGLKTQQGFQIIQETQIDPNKQSCKLQDPDTEEFFIPSTPDRHIPAFHNVPLLF